MPPELKRRPVDRVAAQLRAGRACSDPEFDQVYGHWHRSISVHYWTPVAIASRAARLLTAGGGRRVLDVGSGVGKFCIVGALTTDAVFVGVEQRPRLVAVAQGAAKRLGAGRAVFVAGDFVDLDFSKFDAFYLFNPFEEFVCVDRVPIDVSVDLSPDRFRYCVSVFMKKLRQVRRGARVLTYFGYGGPRPPGFRLVCREAAGEDALILWQKE
jgi:SAM-dependent methyltransferase